MLRPASPGASSTHGFIARPVALVHAKLCVPRLCSGALSLSNRRASCRPPNKTPARSGCVELFGSAPAAMFEFFSAATGAGIIPADFRLRFDRRWTRTNGTRVNPGAVHFRKLRLFLQRVFHPGLFVEGRKIHECRVRPRSRFMAMNYEPRPCGMRTFIDFSIGTSRRSHVRAVQVMVIADYVGGEARTHQLFGVGRQALLLQERFTTGAKCLSAATWTRRFSSQRGTRGRGRSHSTTLSTGSSHASQNLRHRSARALPAFVIFVGQVSDLIHDRVEDPTYREAGSRMGRGTHGVDPASFGKEKKPFTQAHAFPKALDAARPPRNVSTHGRSVAAER